jgi:hypothetical protein
MSLTERLYGFNRKSLGKYPIGSRFSYNLWETCEITLALTFYGFPLASKNLLFGSRP